MLQFYLRIGSGSNARGCRLPQSRDEAVIVDYSRDGGITWSTLRTLDAHMFSHSAQRVAIELPEDARTNGTLFRWWQPLVRAGW